MFEAIKGEVSKRLALASKEVVEFRDRIAEEMTDEAVRKAREHQLEHPDGFSTPLKEAVDRAEAKAAKLRKVADAAALECAKAMIADEAAQETSFGCGARRVISGKSPTSATSTAHIPTRKSLSLPCTGKAYRNGTLSSSTPKKSRSLPT